MPTINIRLTDDDLTIIDSAAAAHGLNRSAWVRLAAMERIPASKMTFPPIDLVEALTGIVEDDPIDPATFVPPLAKTRPADDFAKIFPEAQKPVPSVDSARLSKAHFARRKPKK
jgi:Family of unknown function (DUF6290)